MSSYFTHKGSYQQVISWLLWNADIQATYQLESHIYNFKSILQKELR